MANMIGTLPPQFFAVTVTTVSILSLSGIAHLEIHGLVLKTAGILVLREVGLGFFVSGG